MSRSDDRGLASGAAERKTWSIRKVSNRQDCANDRAALEPICPTSPIDAAQAVVT